MVGVYGGSRELEDQGGSNEIKRREEGGEWGLTRVVGGRESGCSESGYTDYTEDLILEQDGNKVNLGIIDTGGVGFTLGLVDY